MIHVFVACRRQKSCFGTFCCSFWRIRSCSRIVSQMWLSIGSIECKRTLFSS